MKARVAAMLFFCLAAPHANAHAIQNAGQLRVVRIGVGPGGSESGGRYVLSEERTTFSRDSDHQVVVTFEWEGRPGVHRLKATWLNLDQSVSSSSQIEYRAAVPRFGSYWSLPLSQTTPLGQWRLDLTVDDEPAGVAMFRLVGGAAPTVGKRIVLSTAELYDRAVRSTVVLDRRNTKEGVLDPAIATALDPDRLVTGIAAIDDVADVRVSSPKGGTQALASIVAWHVRQGWAVLPVSPLAATPATPASTRPEVGDRCYSLIVGGDGSRVLSEGMISGEQKNEQGEQLFATFVTGMPTGGAPVLNDAGELIGIIRDMNTLELAAGGAWRWRAGRDATAAAIVPVDLVVYHGGQPTAIADLLARGVLIAPLDYDRTVVSGGFAPRIARVAGAKEPVDQRYDFSRQDPSVVVFVTWHPQQRLKGTTMLKMYDEARRQVLESLPGKLNVRGGGTAFSDWKLTVPDRTGIYRVEVLFDGRPAWRDYFRVTR